MQSLNEAVVATTDVASSVVGATTDAANVGVKFVARSASFARKTSNGYRLHQDELDDGSARAVQVEVPSTKKAAPMYK